jgi:hypothetical protein
MELLGSHSAYGFSTMISMAMVAATAAFAGDGQKNRWRSTRFFRFEAGNFDGGSQHKMAAPPTAVGRLKTRITLEKWLIP